MATHVTHVNEQESVAVETSLASSLYADEVGRWPTILRQHGRHKSKSTFIIHVHVFAVLALLATIVLLLSFCRDPKSNVLRPDTLRRRLSGNAEYSGSELVRMCEGMETNGTDSVATLEFRHKSTKGGPSESTTNMPKLTTEERGRAELSSATSLGHSSHEADDSLAPSTTNSKYGVRVAESEMMRSLYGVDMSRLAHQHSQASKSDSVHTPSETPTLRSEDEILAASALVLLQAQVAPDATTQHSLASGVHFSEQKRPRVSVFQAGASMSEAHGSAVSLSHPTTSQSPNEVESLSSASRTAVGQQVDAQHLPLPSSSFVGPPKAQASEAAEPRAHETHIFPQTPSFGSSRLSHKYQRLVLLLSQESLSAEEKKCMLCLVRTIVSRFQEKESSELPKDYALRTIQRLTRRFLVFDVLVSALQVLEIPREGAWWHNLTTRVPHIYEYPLTSTRSKHPEYDKKVVFELQNAIETLKKGDRPSKERLVELNYLLWNHQYSYRDLVNGPWNPHRKNKWTHLGSKDYP